MPHTGKLNQPGFGPALGHGGGRLDRQQIRLRTTQQKRFRLNRVVQRPDRHLASDSGLFCDGSKGDGDGRIVMQRDGTSGLWASVWARSGVKVGDRFDHVA